MTELNPDYDYLTWDAGYQVRQFGVAGDDVAEAASVLPALANPTAEMVTASQTTPYHEAHEPTQ